MSEEKILTEENPVIEEGVDTNEEPLAELTDGRGEE